MKTRIIIALIIIFLIICASLFLFVNFNKKIQGKVVNPETNKDIPEINNAPCGFNYKSSGICAGTCPAGKCTSESGSCYCKVEEVEMTSVEEVEMTKSQSFFEKLLDFFLNQKT